MKKLLIIEALRPLFTAEPSFLHRTDIELSFAATNDDILRRHVEIAADLIVTTFNNSDLSAESLFSIIKQSPDLRKTLLILAVDDTPGMQERARLSGANVLLTLPIDRAQLVGKIRELLIVAPRKAYRVLFNISVEGKFMNRPFLCTSENVSVSGMLVRARERMAPGDHVSCSFFLPDGTRIRATGEVVRAVKQDGGDGEHHYGIHFTEIPDEQRAALGAFIEREQHRLAPQRETVNVV